MSRPMDIGGTPDIAKMLGVPNRACEDLLRDPDAPQVPYFGKLGNARMYDLGLVRSMIPALRAYLDGAPDRSAAKRQATIKAREEALARQIEKFEAEQRAFNDMQSTFKAAQQSRDEVARRRKSASGGQAILLDASGRRVS